MIKLKDDIELMFFALREKRYLILSGGTNTLDEQIIFFEGMFMGFKLFYNIDLEREISTWFQLKAKQKASNMNWFAQFRKCYFHESIEKQKIIFLDLLENFLLFYTKKNPPIVPICRG